MAGLRLEQFAGELPATHPQKLSLANAQTCRNVRLLSGALEPWAAPGKAYDSSLRNPTRTLFRTQYGHWVEWPTWYRVVNTINPNDPYDRIFISGGGEPPQVLDPDYVGTDEDPSYPAGSLRLGVPGPESPLASVRAISHADAIQWADSHGRGYPSNWPVEVDEDVEPQPRSYTYTVTLENNFGEESVPAQPSPNVEVLENETVKLDLPAVPSIADAGDVVLTRYFIYRSSGGPFQYIGSAPIEWNEYVDLTPDGGAAEQLESENNDMPPDDLDGLCVVGGNFLAGFQKNEVLFSAPGLPHAWPTAFRQPVDYTIVELASFGQTLVVMTQGSLYMGQGGHPAGMVLSDTAVHQPCVARESVATLMGGVVYASPDGLVHVTNGGARVISEEMFTRDEWGALNPSSIRATGWYSHYVGFYKTETGEEGGFILDPRRPEHGVVFLDVAYPDAVYTDIQRDRMYMVVDGEILEWGTGEDMSYRWRSRPLDLPELSAVGVVCVYADGYPVTVRLFRDDELQDEVEVQSSKPVRLRNAQLGRRYELEVETTQTIYAITTGTSVVEALHA